MYIPIFYIDVKLGNRINIMGYKKYLDMFMRFMTIYKDIDNEE
jgi:hypothetical protein